MAPNMNKKSTTSIPIYPHRNCSLAFDIFFPPIYLSITLVNMFGSTQQSLNHTGLFSFHFPEPLLHACNFHNPSTCTLSTLLYSDFPISLFPWTPHVHVLIHHSCFPEYLCVSIFILSWSSTVISKLLFLVNRLIHMCSCHDCDESFSKLHVTCAYMIYFLY